MVDTISCKKAGPLQVLVGINDQEFHLIQKSLTARNSLKGKFMSPLVSMCQQNSIPVDFAGRKLTATSSRLSWVSFSRPMQFYKLLWILASKSMSLIRTPQARPFLKQRIPAYVDTYFDEASECMALKIVRARQCVSEQTVIGVVPIENTADVLARLESGSLSAFTEAQIDARIRDLEEERAGLWIPVIFMYLILPAYTVYQGFRFVSSKKLTDFGNYETQGIALGTWVRDTRRD